MKKVAVIVGFLVASCMQAQQVTPTYEVVGDLVKVTSYYKNGAVKEQGFYKDKKLQGTWVTYDLDGNKTAIAHYNSGEKVGKWFMWHKDGLKEVNYEANAIASVQHWKESESIAIK